MSDWTDERAALAKKLWTVDGCSASQVAKALGGVSRNAVIGKLHRMGFTGSGAMARRPASRPGAAPRPPKTQQPRKLRVIGAAVIEEPEARPPRVVVPFRDEPAGQCTILTVRPHQCKWPIGDPQDESFTLCGNRSPQGPYCREHAAIAYQPAQPRKASANELARALRRYV